MKFYYALILRIFNISERIGASTENCHCRIGLRGIELARTVMIHMHWVANEHDAQMT